MLRRRVKSTEAAVREIGASLDRLLQQIVRLNARAADMFVEVHDTVCPFEQARLCLIGLRTMYGHVTLHVGDHEQNVGEFLSDVLSDFGQKRSSFEEHAPLDEDIVSAGKRDAAWIK